MTTLANENQTDIDVTELALSRFLTANGFSDLSEAVAEVSTRALLPEQAVAELGQPSPLVGGLVSDLVAAGGLHAVDITAFVRNGLESRAAFAAIPAEAMDSMLQWLKTSPRWRVDFFFERVLERSAGKVLDDAEYERAYLVAEAAAGAELTPAAHASADRDGVR